MKTNISIFYFLFFIFCHVKKIWLIVSFTLYFKKLSKGGMFCNPFRTIHFLSKSFLL